MAATVERYLSSLAYPAQPERLYSPIIYSMEGGGKRLRPTLVLMACNAFSDDLQSVLPCAGAIEMFHNFTLLHDDIMDNAEVRHGKSTVHRRWDHNTAILSGDAMVVCSYKLLQEAPAKVLPEILREFNTMALEVCEGQQYDIDFESRDLVSVDEYMDMIRLKTAVMFATACKIGAMVGGADAARSDILYRFGIELGLAYQLQDDYLDTYGTTETLGKKIGGDIAESKKTFLTITALEKADDDTRRAMLATLRDNAMPLEQKISRIRAIYNSVDVPAATFDAIDSRLCAAEAALGELNAEPVRIRPLKELIQTLRNRNK